MYGAAFLMLVFFTELPVKHWALGVISANIWRQHRGLSKNY